MLLFLCPCITRSFQIYWENFLVVVLYFLLALYFPWKVLYTLYCALFWSPEVILRAFENTSSVPNIIHGEIFCIMNRWRLCRR